MAALRFLATLDLVYNLYTWMSINDRIALLLTCRLAHAQINRVARTDMIMAYNPFIEASDFQELMDIMVMTSSLTFHEVATWLVMAPCRRGPPLKTLRLAVKNDFSQIMYEFLREHSYRSSAKNQPIFSPSFPQRNKEFIESVEHLVKGDVSILLYRVIGEMIVPVALTCEWTYQMNIHCGDKLLSIYPHDLSNELVIQVQPALLKHHVSIEDRGLVEDHGRQRGPLRCGWNCNAISRRFSGLQGMAFTTVVSFTTRLPKFHKWLYESFEWNFGMACHNNFCEYNLMRSPRIDFLDEYERKLAHIWTSKHFGKEERKSKIKYRLRTQSPP